MKKLNERQKAINLSRSRKQIRLRSRRNKEYNRTAHPVSTLDKTHSKQTFTVKAPTHMSLLENSDETLKFFKDVIDVFRKCTLRGKVFFSFKDVEILSIDSIMYVIALIRNVKRVKAFQISCMGDMPDNKNACEVLEKSGFFNYVTKRTSNAYDNNLLRDTVQIKSGNTAKSSLVGEICDFIHRVSSKTRNDTKRIYGMINELMTNTTQHAYKDDGNIMLNFWYIYIENMENSIKFIFLDTGTGIPNTVRKNHVEKLKSMLINTEASYITSAFRGEFRSETRRKYRGRGLPEIYENVSTNEIQNLQVISGKGYCIPHKDDYFDECKLAETLSGTIFSWEITK